LLPENRKEKLATTKVERVRGLIRDARNLDWYVIRRGLACKRAAVCEEKSTGKKWSREAREHRITRDTFFKGTSLEIGGAIFGSLESCPRRVRGGPPECLEGASSAS
jgi:hypothetical protein